MMMTRAPMGPMEGAAMDEVVRWLVEGGRGGPQIQEEAVAMGVLFSCPADDYDPLDMEEVPPAGTSGGGAVLKALGSSKLLIEGSFSFKRAQAASGALHVETEISIRAGDAAAPAPAPEPAGPLPREVARSRFAELAVESPKHEAAVLRLQKVYKSFRTRRQLADCAVEMEVGGEGHGDGGADDDDDAYSLARREMATGKRTIGLGMDYSPSSKAAARWAIDNLLKAGDRIILVHVIPKGADASHKELWKSTGSPLIPLLEIMEMNVQARYGLVPDQEILEILQAASKAKQRLYTNIR